ncbi:MAG TPA: hypothetical protein VFT22_25535 [Kofleriaceae bacterium]|nr:hypothetical protein [Kofleriaceae bacterium]
MQNDPHCPFFTCGLPLSALEDAFQRAHAHAHAAAPLGGVTAHPLDPRPRAHEDDDDTRADPLLDGHELLRVLREPVEWLLALADRLASSDANDVAAIDRLRAAFHARLAGRPIGVRMSDALTAFGLLLGALDPGVVLQTVSRTVADGVATILACEGAAVAAQLARIVDTLPAMSVHHACAPQRRRRGTACRPHR